MNISAMKCEREKPIGILEVCSLNLYIKWNILTSTTILKQIKHFGTA